MGDRSMLAGLIITRRCAIRCFAPIVLIAIVLQPSISRGDEASSGFSIRKEAPASTDAIADFERYRDKKAWEKAFAAIEKLVAAKSGRLVPAGDGFFIPTSQKIREELLTLPPEGRQAYRLFNDAKADRLYQAVVKGDSDVTGGKGTAGGGPDSNEIATLKTIIDQYFITSIGDQAANRLGDALFENGDYSGAQECWRLILDKYPDSAIEPALLQTKRAIALAEGGRWEDFESLRGIARARYADQKVRIGGRDMPAPDVLDHLASTRPSIVVAATQPAITVMSPLVRGDGATGPPLVLPLSDTPIWQLPLIDEESLNQGRAQLNQMGWGGVAAMLDAVPVTAVDDDRLYANWFGVCFAVDLKTGKMLWRTASFVNLPQQLQQMAMQGQWSAQQTYATVVVGDRVLFVGRSYGGRNSGQPQVTHLLCVKAETGKTLWKSEPGPLADWSFCGAPLVLGDEVYTIAHPSSSQEFFLLTVGLATGELRTKMSLGTPALGQDFRGMPTPPNPVLLSDQGKVYVLTNNGAVLAVDRAGQRIDWAFTCPTHVEQARQFFFRNQQANSDPVAPGAMLIAGGTLLMKERGADVLYALDLAGPSLKWKRPIDSSVTLAHAAGQNIYLAGNEIDCIDMNSRAMQWSTKLSTGTGDVQPLLNGGRIYVFGSRGIHEVQVATGDAGPIFRGADHDCAGGALWQTADRLVTVSNLAVTAYPLSAGASP